MSTKESEIDKAFVKILNELHFKDERIRQLERQVQELNLQLQSQESQTQNINTNKEFYNLNKLLLSNQSTYPNYLNDSNRINSNRYSDKRFKTHSVIRTTKTPSDSFLSGGQTRNDVKAFLSEVKNEIDPKTFKEFIKCIKMLTNKTIPVDKYEIFENVKLLFGEKNKELYKKFEEALGIIT